MEILNKCGCCLCSRLVHVKVKTHSYICKFHSVHAQTARWAMLLSNKKEKRAVFFYSTYLKFKKSKQFAFLRNKLFLNVPMPFGGKNPFFAGSQIEGKDSTPEMDSSKVCCSRDWHFSV